MHEQTVPFQFFIRVLKMVKFSEDFIWCGKEFQTFGPRYLKPFVPYLTWFRLSLEFIDSACISLVLDGSSFSALKCPLWNEDYTTKSFKNFRTQTTIVGNIHGAFSWFFKQLFIQTTAVIIQKTKRSFWKCSTSFKDLVEDIDQTRGL